MSDRIIICFIVKPNSIELLTLLVYSKTLFQSGKILSCRLSYEIQTL